MRAHQAIPWRPQARATGSTNGWTSRSSGAAWPGGLLARQLLRSVARHPPRALREERRARLARGRVDRRAGQQLPDPSPRPLALPLRGAAAEERPALLLRRRGEEQPDRGDERDRQRQSLPVSPRLPDRSRAPRRRPAPHERRGRAPSSTWAPRVQRLELGEGGAPHRFEVREGGRTQAVECRWLADASGRAGLVARAKGLRAEGVEPQHQRGLGPLRERDRLDDSRPRELPRARPPHEPRPLDGSLLLPGLLDLVHPDPQRRDQRRRGRRPAARRARHPHARGLPRLPGPARDGARPAASTRATSTPRATPSSPTGRTRYFHADRWGLTGRGRRLRRSRSTARARTSSRSRTTSSPISWCATSRGEPARSAGRAHRALRPLHALPLRDGHAALPRPVRAARQPGADAPQVGFRHRALLQPLGVGLHAGPAPRRRVGCAASCARSASCSRRCGTSRRSSRRRGGASRPRARYYRANLGGFSFGLEFIDFVEEIGQPRTRRQVLEKTGEIFNSVYLRTRELLGEPEPRAARRSHAADLVHGGPTAGVTARPRAPRSAGRAGGRPARDLLGFALLGGALLVYPWAIDAALARFGVRPVAAVLLGARPARRRRSPLGGRVSLPAHRPSARARLPRGAIAVLLAAALADRRRALPAARARGRLPLARAARGGEPARAALADRARRALPPAARPGLHPLLLPQVTALWCALLRGHGGGDRLARRGGAVEARRAFSAWGFWLPMGALSAVEYVVRKAWFRYYAGGPLDRLWAALLPGGEHRARPPLPRLHPRGAGAHARRGLHAAGRGALAMSGRGRRVVVTGMAGLCALGSDWADGARGAAARSARASCALPELRRDRGPAHAARRARRLRAARGVAAQGAAQHGPRRSARGARDRARPRAGAGLAGSALLRDGSTGIAYGSTSGSPPDMVAYARAFGVDPQREGRDAHRVPAPHEPHLRREPRRLLRRARPHRPDAERLHLGQPGDRLRLRGDPLRPRRRACCAAAPRSCTRSRPRSSTCCSRPRRATTRRTRRRAPSTPTRDGLVVGEGAATLVLEELEQRAGAGRAAAGRARRLRHQLRRRPPDGARRRRHGGGDAPRPRRRRPRALPTSAT